MTRRQERELRKNLGLDTRWDRLLAALPQMWRRLTARRYPTLTLNQLAQGYICDEKPEWRRP